MTLRFDNREYLRSRSFRILEPRDSVLSLLDLVVFTTYHYVLRVCGIHIRIHNVFSIFAHAAGRRERFQRFRRARTVLEISYDVAMWHFIEASYSVKIECVYKGLHVKEL